jgi:phosphoribosylformylglycinamidine synthase
LRTDGINCDEELFYGFQIAGGESEMVHVNELLNKQKRLNDFQILALPGGFSYGDDILSAKVLANELIYKLGDAIDRFIKKDKLILGICNGFQALVRMGLLPWKMGPAEDISLIFNDTGRFECRWVKLHIENSNCIFTKGLNGQIFEMPVAHGEGKFVVKNSIVKNRLKDNNYVAVKYTNDTNPNGSHDNIAGITDTTGRIFGLMPHPERNMLYHHLPTWRRDSLTNDTRTISCVQFFHNAIDYFL